MSLKPNGTISIPFIKMQGAGNDFIVIDNRDGIYSEQQIIEWAPELCDRRFGIGSDGIMALQPAENEDLDFTMLYRNPDGSEAGMCGNGARCLALYASRLGLGETLTFNVDDHTYRAEITGDNRVCIHFPVETRIQEEHVENTDMFKLDTGTEHIVLTVEEQELEDEDALRIRGRELRNHPRFQPAGTNVNFISGSSVREVRIQTYERGVEDLTLACGTGAMAGALVWHYISDPRTESSQQAVQAKGGTLTVYFHYDETRNLYTKLKLEGPAHFVFEGTCYR